MRKSAVLLILTGLLSPVVVQADDVSDKFGVTGIVGSVFPLAPDAVTNELPGAGLDLGAMISLPIGRYMGIGLSYENVFLGDDRRMAPLNALFLVRLMPESRWTPTFMLGGGVARTTHTQRYENSTFKLGAGLDYFVTPTWSIGPQVNYYLFSHAGDASDDIAHLVGVNAAVTYYFGSPSGKN
jgi:hypothetical protein